MLRMSYSTCSRGPGGVGRGSYSTKTPLPNPLPWAPAWAAGGYLHFMFISISFRAVPFLVSDTARA